MSKKRKLALTLSILAVLVAFCLWYTRPRTFDDLVDGREAVDLAAIATCPSAPGGVIDFNTWGIDSKEHGSQVLSGMQEQLSSTRYRLRLRNLLPLPLPTSHSGPMTSIQIVMVMDDESTLFISFWDDEVIFSGDDMGIVTTAVDETTADRIVRYMNEYGTADPENTK